MRSKRGPSVIAALAALAALCLSAAAPAAAQSSAPPAAQSFARPASIPVPASNPLSRAAVDLGRRLFNDPFLSQSGTRACATCHYPSQSFSDGLPKARAFGRELQRNTPALWNLAWAKRLFWDGRAASLEEQAIAPLTSAAEMGASLAEAARRIAARPGYAEGFAQAFPDTPQITEENLRRALAGYERSLVSPPTRFDRWAGGDAAVLSAEEARGFALFTGAAGCAACHSGFAFSDWQLHSLGAEALRTPPLREIAYSAPYLHDGSAATLADALRAHGGAAAALAAEERDAVLAFLATLSSAAPPVASPPLDASGAIVTHVTPG